MSDIRWCKWILVIVALNRAFVRSIPIDNGVEGDPEIECGPSTITVTFNTRNNFEGHVFVKGRYGEAGCRTDQSGKKTASLSLPFATCGVDRQRSLNPKGIFIGVAVVITFHPQFLTKVDRAYSVQCFYMEADKTVSQDLEVSEITTAFQTQNVPMPICRYDILDGGPNGEPLKFGVIGQQVYHKWTCDTESIDIFCMVVHSCFVDDGSAGRIPVVNDQGCALDKYIINNLEYISDLMAGKEAHIFKFADKPSLFFQCQISVSIKEPGEECPRPQCAEAGGLGVTGGTLPPGPATSPAVLGGTAAGRSSNAPRTPPLGRTAPPSGGSSPIVGAYTAGGTSPKAPGSTGAPVPNVPGTTPVRSPPSATPPATIRSPGIQPDPPGLALPVIANIGRTLPAPGPVLPLVRSTAKPSLTSPPALGSTRASRPNSSTRATRPISPTSPPASSRSATASRVSPTTATAPSTPRSTTGPPPTTGHAAKPASSASTSAKPRTDSRARITSPATASLYSRPGIGSSEPGPNPPAPVITPLNSNSAPNKQGAQSKTPSTTLRPPIIFTIGTAPHTAAPAVQSPASRSANASRPAPAPSSSNQARPGDTNQGSPRFDFESTFPFRLRRVRSVDFIGTWDVRAPPLNTYEDFDNELELRGLPANQSPLDGTDIAAPGPSDYLYCVPTVLIGLIVGVTLLSFLASIVVALFLCLRRRGGKYYVD